MTAGVAGCQGNDGEQSFDFEFEAAMGGWKGVAPDPIEDVVNPALELEPGETYSIKWTNTDGFEHNFVILDQAGDELFRTGTIEEAGKARVVEFTASEAMTQYLCEVHPAVMRGDVDIAGRDDVQAPYEQETVVPKGESIGLESVAEGLNAPLGLEVAPGVEDRQFVVDQPGEIYVIDDDGVRDEPFLDIRGQVVDLGDEELSGYDERGLLGLTFHPDFRENRRFFVRYSAPRRAGTPDDYDHTDVLAEFTASEDFETGDVGSERTIWEVPSPQMNHNGGGIAFSPDDGYLYMSIGDGGDADDTGPGHVSDWYGVNEGGNAQDITENLLGSVHRLDVDAEPTEHPRADDSAPEEPDGDEGYAIPDDNPLVGEDGLAEQYAWGFRNPWRLSFDADGRLFVSDAGQNRFEEVNLVEKGGNYGWNVKEGSHCFSTERPSAPPDELSGCPDSTYDDVRDGEQLRDPIIEYPHRFRTTAFIDGSVAIGGYVYEGDAIDHLQGTYVLGNWSGRGIRDPDGEIFVATDPGAEDGGDGTETPDGDTPTDGTPETDAQGGDTDAQGGETDGGTAATEQWSLEELVVEGSNDGKLNRYVYAFGRDHDGELYVLTNTDFRPGRDGTGEVFEIVPAGEGEQIADPSPDGAGSNGTESDGTGSDGNGTRGNGANGNRTNGDGTNGNGTNETETD